MAHKTNVTQGFRASSDSQSSKDAFPNEVVDPVCGEKIDRRTAKHMIFREDATHYFCSKECQAQFGKPPSQQTGKKSAA